MSSIIYNNLQNRIPFCFVRINDGEASAISSPNAILSRGDERSSSLMSEKLSNIIDDPYSNSSLFIGIPCSMCYNEHYNTITNRLKISKSTQFIRNNVVDANILINNNYNKTFEIVRKLQNIIVISNETIINNINKLNTIGITVLSTITVSSTLAFDTDYENTKSITFPDNSTIITLCGPLGRVLCYEYYKNNNTLTCLDLGSFFDPLLRNKSYLYHTNNHKYCQNCYPTSDDKYTKIFDYCDDVDKECYYLNNYNDNLSLYNNDWNRIILNTNIRLEKSPDLFSQNLLIFATACQYAEENNLIFNKDHTYLECLLEICEKFKPVFILQHELNSSTFVFSDYISRNVNEPIQDMKCITVCNNITSPIKDIEFCDINNIPNNIPNNSTTLIHIHNTDYFKIIASIAKYYKLSNVLLLVDHPELLSHLVKKKIIKLVYEKINESPSIYSYDDCSIMDIEHELSIGIYMSSCNNNQRRIETYIEANKLLTNILSTVEGYTFQNHELFDFIIEFCNGHDFHNILEIGFLHGTSSLLFLMNTSANVTSIDINPSSNADFLSKKYNKFTFIQGDSNNITTDLINNNYFDLIFIDGSHDYNVIKKDLYNAIQMLHIDGYIIINDVVSDDMKMCWNTGPNKIYEELLNGTNTENIPIIIKNITAKTFCKGRGLVIFQITRQYYTAKMTKKELYSEIQRFVNSSSSSIFIKSDIFYELIDVYLHYFSFMISNEEKQDLLVMRCKSINELENINIDNNIKNKKINNYYALPKTSIIPKIIHLIYLNERPLQSYNYKCIYSIIKHHPTFEIWIHNDIEPDTKEWKELINSNSVSVKKTERIRMFSGLRIEYIQYEADILRMTVLEQYGGIYMDIDVYIFKNIEPLLKDNYSLYICKETENSLINCIIISEPNNGFIKEWLSLFSSGFRMGIWAWHIRELPKILLENNKHYYNKYGIKLLDHTNFCPMHWTEKNKLSDGTFSVTENVYGIHLFETILGNYLDTCLFLIEK
jgi:mannosyltransferase OCH1-like enzyme